MTVATRPTRSLDASRVELVLLSRLGLASDPTPEAIEGAHDRLISFLETAPDDLQRWAGGQIAAADEAYALLSDAAGPELGGTAGRLAPAGPSAPAIVAPRRNSAAPEPPARRPSAPVRARSVAADDELPEELEETEGAGMPVRRARSRATVPAARHPATKRGGAGLLRNRLVRRAIVGVAAAGAALVVAFTVYSAGAPTVPGINGSPAPESSSGPPIDQQQVAALMQKISANPKDTASLIALGDLYFQAGDYQTAADFMQKAVDVAPDNTDARLAFGAAQFNLGNPAAASEQWQAVLKLDPKNIEAYYDLGFMYLNQNPPDMANVTLNWNKVVEIDPTSSIAQTVQTHLAALQPSASPGASGVPAAGTPASGTPAPGTPAPQATASPAGTGK